MCFCASLSRLLWDSFLRVLASLGPFPSLVCFCSSVLASLGQLLLFRVPASLGPSPWLCSSVLYCPGFSGTVFCGSWVIWVPSPLLSRSTAWERGLDITHWRHLKSTCCFCLTVLLGAFVLLGSQLLWVSAQPLCASAFLSWLLWDSLYFFRVPASLGASPLLCAFVLYCPGFSGTAFWGSWLTLVLIFPASIPTIFSFFSLRNPLSPTFPDKNPKKSQIFLARFLLCPFFLLGIRDFSKFLVGKVRTCIYLPPPTILGKFPNMIPDRISSDLGKSQIGTWQEKWE